MSYRLLLNGILIQCDTAAESCELVRAAPFVEMPEMAERHRLKVAELEKAKTLAYDERNRLVAALSKVLPAHLARHPESDLSWDRDWMNIVCIHLPIAEKAFLQATWHIRDSEMPWFAHLSDNGISCPGWDGHTTEEKYRRIGEWIRDVAVKVVVTGKGSA